MAHRFSKESLEFMAKASRQKSAEWLDRNEQEYQKVLVEPFRHLAQEVARHLRREAPGYRFPVRGFARIRRSAARAAAQGWYKDWAGLLISRDSGSRYEDLPNLYFHLSAEDQFSAGGLYLASAGQVRRIRDWIAKEPSALERLLEEPAFTDVYRELGDERKVKTFPRGFPKDHPRIEWLKLTGFYVWRPFPRKSLFSESFPEILASDWSQALKLNRVLDEWLARAPGIEIPPQKKVRDAEELQETSALRPRKPEHWDW
jgi:uncharacterized protein (TIGR02453 family)